MSSMLDGYPAVKHTHDWLRQMHVVYIPGPEPGIVKAVAAGILSEFKRQGHQLQERADEATDLILTSATFGQPVPWRESLMLAGRRRLGLKHAPTVYTLMPVSPADFERTLAHFEAALKKEPPDPADFQFPGMTERAHRVLIEQGRRGGPILSFVRLVQSQSMSIRVLLIVGEDQPQRLLHFDLVGSHPVSEAHELAAFYRDIVLRIVTTESTHEVTSHELGGEPISMRSWRQLQAPQAMRRAGQELGERGFFTEMVRIADLVNVPAVPESVASQYSEGCFATWEPALQALVATITGSARPVDKGNIGDDDLAVIVGTRPDGRGALVRHVEGKRNDPPSSEAVEMMEMDSSLPTIAGPDGAGRLPVARSKLHGHRGVSRYAPQLVEYLELDPPYYDYLVSCATEAQARGIKSAFSRSQALNHPEDRRQLAFTVLPGHGVVIVEKWVAGKAPFQMIWEAMDSGALQLDNKVPQGPMYFAAGAEGLMELQPD
jgi:hypothetical protein